MNKAWHNKNVLGQGTPLDKRISWHLAHQKNCSCRPMPKSIALAIKGKKLKTCSRGHRFIGTGACPICWPGRNKK